MERCNHPDAVNIVELSSQPGDRRTTLQHRLGSKLAEATDDFRTDRRNLPLQKWAAGDHFIRLRVSVVGWPAFKDVADVGVFPLDPGGLDDLGEKATGLADKRQSLLVLFIARRFTHEDDLCIGIAGTENDCGTCGREFAPLAVSDVGADGVQGIWSGDVSYCTRNFRRGNRNTGGQARNHALAGTEVNGFNPDVAEELQLLDDVVKSHSDLFDPEDPSPGASRHPLPAGEGMTWELIYRKNPLFQQRCHPVQNQAGHLGFAHQRNFLNLSGSIND